MQSKRSRSPLWFDIYVHCIKVNALKKEPVVATKMPRSLMFKFLTIPLGRCRKAVTLWKTQSVFFLNYLLCNPGSAHKGFLGGYSCRLTLQRTILTPTKFYTPTYIHTSFIYMMYIVLGNYLIILQLQKIIFPCLP